MTGVTSELKDFAGNTEFLFVGSCLHGKGLDNSHSGNFFSSAGDAQELYCHMDAGYQPIQHAFGNISYMMGMGGGIMGSLKAMARGEIKEYSDVFNATRHKALDRIVAQAKSCNANAVVGIRTKIMVWHMQYTESLAMHSREKQNVLMARPTRVDLPGVWYHVLNRGIEKRAIFRSARCYERFIELLSRLPERFGVQLHGYVLMGTSGQR